MEYSNYDILKKLLDFKTNMKGIEKRGINKQDKFSFKFFKLSDLFDEITNKIEKELSILITCNIKYKENDIFTCNLMFFDVILNKSFVFEYDLPLDTQQKNRVQAGGATWTYAYRYGLQMFFNITDNQDDPDNKEIGVKYNGNKPVKSNESKSNELIGQKQFDEMKKLFAKNGIENAKDKLTFIREILPDLKSATDITISQWENDVKPKLL
jgi:hypothetical protein